MPDVPPDQDEAALRAVIEAKDAEIAALREQVGTLSAQVAELRDRLRQSPRNSSRPPSSEGLVKPAPRSLRRKTGRRPGRPTQQPGVTLEMTDRRTRWSPMSRAGAAGAFSAELTGTERRQGTDLPEDIAARVTEHRMVSRRCSCGTVTAGAAGVAAPVQYGPRLSAAAVYLWHGQFLSRDRTCQAIGELFGVWVSPGAVRRIVGKLGAPLAAIGKALVTAGVLHADETGFRVAGRLACVHSASSGKFALVTVHGKRERETMDAAGVLPAFGGVLVHDCRGPYDTHAHLTHAV